MGPILYRPPPRWQVVTAFVGALALHGAAVAIASIHPAPPPPADLDSIPEAVEMSLDTTPEPPMPTPPPEEEPPPPPPPEAIPEEKPEFVEENKTPPPKRPPSTKPVQPVARPSNPGPTGPPPTGKAAMIYKPRIDYPYEARRSKITGSGTIVISVNPDGSVGDVSMGQSTGSPILDNTATTAFRRARFKPGTVPRVKVPITFTLTGASDQDMRMRSPIPHKKARIEIIPLIDIMFFLLASFMMVSLSQTHMKGIKVNLPSQVNVPKPPDPTKKDYVSVRVSEGNSIYFDNELVMSDQVLPRLTQIHKTEPDKKVSISADKFALHGDVIDVLDKARQVGIQKIGYQVKVAAGEAGAPGAAPPPVPAPPPPRP